MVPLMYEGEMKHDKFNGKGNVFYPDGTLAYEAEWNDSLPHGKKGRCFTKTVCSITKGSGRMGIQVSAGFFHANNTLEYTTVL